MCWVDPDPKPLQTGLGLRSVHLHCAAWSFARLALAHQRVEGRCVEFSHTIKNLSGIISAGLGLPKFGTSRENRTPRFRLERAAS